MKYLKHFESNQSFIEICTFIEDKFLEIKDKYPNIKLDFLKSKRSDSEEKISRSAIVSVNNILLLISISSLNDESLKSFTLDNINMYEDSKNLLKTFISFLKEDKPELINDLNLFKDKISSIFKNIKGYITFDLEKEWNIQSNEFEYTIKILLWFKWD